MAAALVMTPTAFVGGGVQETFNDARAYEEPMISKAKFFDGGLVDTSSVDCSSEAVSSCLSVESGFEDTEEEDVCSICLENFGENDPCTSTSCNHDFHLYCILEWGQRGKECPMCMQLLSLKDPISQSLLAASQQQRLAHGLSSTPYRQYSTSDETHVQRFAATYGRDTGALNRSISAHNRGAVHPSSTRRSDSLEQHDEHQQGRSSSASVSEKFNFKSRLAAASFKYRNSFSKTTRDLRERLRLRNHGAMGDLGSQGREMSAGVDTSLRSGEQ